MCTLGGGGKAQHILNTAMVSLYNFVKLGLINPMKKGNEQYFDGVKPTTLTPIFSNNTEDFQLTG